MDKELVKKLNLHIEEFESFVFSINKTFNEVAKTLKPCPFCGDTPELIVRQEKDEDDLVFWRPCICCSNCDITFSSVSDLEEYESSIEAMIHVENIVDSWNTRVE